MSRRPLRSILCCQKARFAPDTEANGTASLSHWLGAAGAVVSGVERVAPLFSGSGGTSFGHGLAEMTADHSEIAVVSGSGGREAEGGGLLNRYRVLKPYRGFESLPLRRRMRVRHPGGPAVVCNPIHP